MIHSKTQFEQLREPHYELVDGFLIDKSEQLKYIERNEQY